MMGQTPIRVGAVSYLNTKPLIYQFQRFAPGAELTLDYPSRLADGLADGSLDAALVPSIEYFKQPSYTILSDACIACRGPVLSVKLFCRVPPEAIRTVALDEGSRTSIALVRILLEERLGVCPQFEPLGLEAHIEDCSADAVLVIGDRAIHSPPGGFAEVWDLGDQWCRWAQLPFVFAMWVARPGWDTSEIEAGLSMARDAGLAALPEIAAREAASLGLTEPECLTYLRDSLYFYLGPRERTGLELFYDHACRLGLAPEGVKFESPRCPTVG